MCFDIYIDMFRDTTLSTPFCYVMFMSEGGTLLYVETCASTCVQMCMDTRMDMCMGLYTRTNLCTDMCIDMRIAIYIDTCACVILVSI